MLRDLIMFGINNRDIQQRLLAEKILTLAKTIELTQGMETAAKNVKELSQREVPSTSSSGNVHRVTPPTCGKDTCSNMQKFSGNCFCRGIAGHKRASFRFKDAVCCRCGKAGHLLRVCHAEQASCQVWETKAIRKKTVHLEEGPEESSDDMNGNYDSKPSHTGKNSGSTKSLFKWNWHGCITDASVRVHFSGPFARAQLVT